MICKTIKQNKGLSTVLVLSSFGALVYVRNRIIPKFADDYPFSFIWDGKNHGNLTFGKKNYKRIRTMKDLVRSQVSHYLTWSGRTIGEGLNQLLLMEDDKKYFDRANTAMTLLQILMCDWIGHGKIRFKDIPVSLAGSLAVSHWFGTPHLPFTTMWQTGALNYSWPGVLQSAYILPYSMAMEDKELDYPLPAAVISGLLAGWSNEAGGGIACLLSGAQLLYARFMKEDKRWQWCGFVSACIGYALLMLAPGNITRYKWEQEYSDILPDDFSKTGFVPSEFLYKPEMFKHFFKVYITTVLRLSPASAAVVLGLLSGRERKKEQTLRILALEAASLIVPSILMLSPEFPKHAAYPAVIYALSAMSAAWEHIDHEGLHSGYGKLMSAGKTACAAYLSINLLASLTVDVDWGIQMRESEDIIRAAKGKEEVLVPQTVISPFWSAIAGDRAIDRVTHEIGQYQEDAGDPYNMAAAAYYGVGSVRATSGDEHPYNAPGSPGKQILLPWKRFIRYLKKHHLLFG